MYRKGVKLTDMGGRRKNTVTSRGRGGGQRGGAGLLTTASAGWLGVKGVKSEFSAEGKFSWEEKGKRERGGRGGGQETGEYRGGERSNEREKRRGLLPRSGGG